MKILEETKVNYYLTVNIEKEDGLYYVKHIDSLLNDVAVDLYTSYSEDDIRRFYNGYISLFPSVGELK